MASSARPRLKDQQGFTLLETMIAVAISGILLTAFFMALSGTQQQMDAENNYFQATRSVRHGFERIEEDVREAVGIVASLNGETTEDDVIILKLPSIDAAGEPIDIASRFDHVIYKLNGSVLERSTVLDVSTQRDGGNEMVDRVIAGNMSNLAFSYDGTGLSAISSAALPTLKHVDVRLTARMQTINPAYQTVESGADISLTNNIT